jgi:hypothetical protein
MRQCSKKNEGQKNSGHEMRNFSNEPMDLLRLIIPIFQP